MAMISSRRSIRRLLRSFQAALDTYSIRFSIGLIASLLFVIGLTHFPLREATPRVGWNAQTADEGIHLSDFRIKTENDRRSESRARTSETPITKQGNSSNPSSDDEAPPPTSEDPADTTTDSGTEEDPSSMRQSALKLAALGPFGHKPRFVGGRGSFYLRIGYPEEARQQGIEGRVVLDFIVDTDGVTRDIRVTQSLHPLCDSSAVAALKQTQFIPGRRDGKKVPVRMRLPVRFQLINYTVNTTDAEPQKPPPNPL